MSTGRRSISKEVEKNVLVASRRRCCLCYYISGIKNHRTGQIAHLSQNAADTDFDDLVYLCLEHHADFDSKSRQAKGYTQAEVKHHRNELYEEIERQSEESTGESAQGSTTESQPAPVLPPAAAPPTGDDKDRPRFTVKITSSSRTATSFQPEFSIQQASGTSQGKIEWRIRGARFEMEWRQALVADLPRTTITGQFDLTKPPSDESTVGPDQLGLEVRFNWLQQARVELHRWPIEIEASDQKQLVEIGDEVLPPLEIDNDHAHDNLDYCLECGKVACYRCGYWFKLDNKCSRCGFIYSNE